MTQPRYNHQDLLRFATALLQEAGLEQDKAAAVADVLVEADLLGHDTHGLALLAPYLSDIEAGGMAKTGQPAILTDRPAAMAWDGVRLPGPWLVLEAIRAAIPRARQLGTCSVAIRRSHHIACLAAYLKRVTDEGLMILLMSSDPSTDGVAPHGGRRSVYTPNPIAAAWPTEGDPVVIDISTSFTTHGMTSRLHKEGKRLPGNWLIDADGNPTNDAAVMFREPKGAMLPLGGVEAGHKGYALGLLVETLTGGLAGHGRAELVDGWGANVFVQILEPACFGGVADFRRQTEWVAAACRATPPRPGFDRVRLPGERGLERRSQQLVEGVRLHPAIFPQLSTWADKLGIAQPQPLA
jgi:L-lactate dehydrogenase